MLVKGSARPNDIARESYAGQLSFRRQHEFCKVFSHYFPRSNPQIVIKALASFEPACPELLACGPVVQVETALCKFCPSQMRRPSIRSWLMRLPTRFVLVGSHPQSSSCGSTGCQGHTLQIQRKWVCLPLGLLLLQVIYFIQPPHLLW